MIDPGDGKVTENSEPETSGSGEVLSAEEQMERFEEDLKENDWGHQPC
jgi:hypothetical protein